MPCLGAPDGGGPAGVVEPKGLDPAPGAGVCCPKEGLFAPAPPPPNIPAEACVGAGVADPLPCPNKPEPPVFCWPLNGEAWVPLAAGAVPNRPPVVDLGALELPLKRPPPPVAPEEEPGYGNPEPPELLAPVLVFPLPAPKRPPVFEGVPPKRPLEGVPDVPWLDMT